MHTYNKLDIKVIDEFVDKFAKRYVQQRSESALNYSEISKSSLFNSSGFKGGELQKIITQNSVAKDFKRDVGGTPTTLNDIYRSDLGELLLTYYFEEKLPVSERFIIPIKNISDRELAEQPGRGLDALGYRVDGDKVIILLGEAKVSSEKKSPPQVVHASEDSIYNTQKKWIDNEELLIKRLTDQCRKLDIQDAEKLGYAILSIQYKMSDNYSYVLGCVLIRDHSCVNRLKDFGNLEKDQLLFNPHVLNCVILSFSDKTINETVDLFYRRVKLEVKAA